MDGAKMRRSHLRGHPIIFLSGSEADDGIEKWVYEDTRTPTEGNPRPCGHCKKDDTTEGHDGCLGTLPGVNNACCGHGVRKESYIQFENGMGVRGFIIEKVEKK